MTYQRDPLQEKKHEVLPGLIWKYQNRVLFLTTKNCPSKCEFCFRKNLYDKNFKRTSDIKIIDFVKKHKQIKEFIFSGGEPLIVINEIYSLIKELVKIEHLKLFRIHTKLPITYPNKVNLRLMKKVSNETDKPIYLVIHVNTDKEINNSEAQMVIKKLRSIGYVLLSHTVFLKGINDNFNCLKNLFSTLIELGVKPYYIFHCDNMEHTQKFIVPIEKEVKIMTELRKQLSGIAYPIHVIDSESGKGKIPVPTNFWKFKSKQYRDFD